MIAFIAVAALALSAFVYFTIKSRKEGREAFADKAVCRICHAAVAAPKYVDGWPFCPEHATLFAEGRWVELHSGKAAPNEPETGVRLNDLKERMAASGVRALLDISYDRENGEIVTLMKLKVLEEDLEKARRFPSP